MTPAPLVWGVPDMHEIQHGLWLGSAKAAGDKASLLSLGFTHILSIGCPNAPVRARQRFRLPPSDADPFDRLVIAVEDAASSRLDRHFEVCSSFIKEGLSLGGNVLVHCQAGQSRSPTIVMAYLMLDRDWTACDALKYVRHRRAAVCPNPGFMTQLHSLEAQKGLGASNKVDMDALLETSLDSDQHPAKVARVTSPVDAITDTFANQEALAKLARLQARLGSRRTNFAFTP